MLLLVAACHTCFMMCMMCSDRKTVKAAAAAAALVAALKQRQQSIVTYAQRPVLATHQGRLDQPAAATNAANTH
jgi:hypothetical protein